jgi:AcrR family transcriptional regulator
MSSNTSDEKTRRRRRRRQSFLQAAVTLFGMHGYHATTVPMILQAASSSTGAFYSYFRNKEDVFAAALQCVAETIASGRRKTIAGFPDAQTQLRSVVGHRYRRPN